MNPVSGRWNEGKVFLLLLAVLAFLSYLPWSLGARIVLFPAALLGLVLAAHKGPSDPSKARPLFLEEFLPAPSIPWVAALVGLALFLRYFHLTSLQAWPTWDDAYLGYFGIGLSENWRWSLSIGSQDTSPLFTYLQGAFFRIFEPSLFSLWLFPALLASLVIPAGYFAARQYASRSYSLLFTVLLGLSFPAVYWGRFGLGVSLELLGWLALAGTLGWTLRSPSFRRAMGLGFCAAAGLYVSILSLIPCCWVFGILVWDWYRRKDRRGVAYLGCGLVFVLLSLPLFMGIFPKIVHGHLSAHVGLQGISGARHFITFFSYPTAFFFGCIDRSYWNFGPLWGGLLNPIPGAFFFLGLGVLARPPYRTVEKFLALGFGLVMGPLLWVKMVECLRTAQLLPLVLGVSALGAVSLLQGLRKERRWPALLLLLAVSLSLDGWHLFGVFHRWSVTEALTPGLAVKSPERYRAFQALEAQAQQEGPGLVFSDFVPDVYDASLLVATYPFNSARNPRLDPAKARWAGVLFELHYLKELKEKFPDARLAVLGADGTDGPILAMALVPLDNTERAEQIRAWSRVHRELQDLYGSLPLHIANPDFHPVFRAYQKIYPQAGADPFLRGWVLEKILDLLWLQEDMTDALWLLDQPLGNLTCFPWVDLKTAHVHHKLGMALLKGGNKAKARECFMRAAKLDPHYDLKKSLALVK